MCSRSLLFVLAVAISAHGQLTPSTPAAWSVRTQPLQLVNGSPVLFSVKPPKAVTAMTGTWLGNSLTFTQNPKDKTWYAFGGVALKTKPGIYTLKLVAGTKSGESTFDKRISVKRGKYRKIAIQVARKFTEPDAEQVRKIGEDKSRKEVAFHKSDPDREWSGNFAAPVKAVLSDRFGTQRTFNGKVQSTHQGLDYAAGAGTPVAAVNSGTVVLAGPLYFEGNCVVLDHGQGLQTLYMHLSEIKVEEGARVTKGEELGLVGGTGRATGPHLHLGVRWRGEYLDPSALLALKLPK
jgi:murein DD-endopeptidase MepM/ murein hydrolase activator NlpD